jgi:hypothetical protein
MKFRAQYGHHAAFGDDDIMALILQKARLERNVDALITAYVVDLVDAWRDANGAEVPDFDSIEVKQDWETKVLRIVHTEAEVEAEFLRAYVAFCVEEADIAPETAAEWCVPPDGVIRDTVPLEVIRSLAHDLAMRDAADARAMREVAAASKAGR